MVRRWIGSLRNKPKSVRDNVALSVAGGVTVLVVLGWLFVTPTTVTDVASEAKAQPSAFSTLFDQLRDQTAAVTDSFNEAKETVTEEWEDAQASSSTETTVSIEDSEDSYSPTSTIMTETATTTGFTASTSTPRTVRIATTTNDSE